MDHAHTTRQAIDDVGQAVTKLHEHTRETAHASPTRYVPPAPVTAPAQPHEQGREP